MKNECIVLIVIKTNDVEKVREEFGLCEGEGLGFWEDGQGMSNQGVLCAKTCR